MYLRLLIAISIAALLSSCTTDPYTGQEKASNAVKVGAGAAAACGLLGSLKNNKTGRRAALGCGIVGLGVGVYMDEQERKLREQLEGTGVRVAREGDNIRLIMPGNITFETDSYNLRANFYSVLDSVALVLAEFEETTMRVSGHTDNTGSRDYNMELSQKRARSVADYLAGRGVSATRMQIRGLAFDQPIADNASAEGRAQNRRVELYILPNPA